MDFDPAVIESLPGTQSLLGVYCQQFNDQIAALIAEMLRKVEIFKLIGFALLRKGGLDGQHFVHEYANTPAIYFIIVVVSFCDFRGNIIKSAAKGSTLFVCFNGPAEICDFQVFSKANYVFGFEISVNDAVSVKILYA